MLSTAFWLAGAIVLFRIAVRFAAPGVALMVAGYYLFLPLGIEVSTIFLPEPLMMAAYLLSLLLILRHHEAPAPKRLLAAALVSGAAVLIKPLCLFAIIGAFAGLWLCRARRERSVEYGSALAFLSITLTVGAAYYVYGLFLSDLMADKAGSSFFPHLLLTGEFWSQWPRTALEAFGVVPVILALLGLPALSRNVPRGLVFGVLASYPVFLATFAYHVRFADYYHLQMIPAVALAATPVLTRAVRYARSTFSRREAVPLLLLALAVAWWGVFTELESRQAGRTAIESRKVAREIGELVGHSVRVVFVSPYYGNPLSYHAEVAGDFWRRAPGEGESWKPDLGPADLLERFRVLNVRAEYVVVTDLIEFEQHHADLADFLETECEPMAKTDAYLVYRVEECVPDPVGKV